MEQNKNMTAVEWLVEQLRKQNPLYTKNELIQIAKEMEKERAIDMYIAGLKKGNLNPASENLHKVLAEQYYNETYGTTDGS
jgi:hypothetical protein